MIHAKRSGISPRGTATTGVPAATPTATTRTPPHCTAEHLLNCSFERWYQTFRRVSPRSVIVPLPAAYVAYMLRDRVVLPLPTAEVPLRPTDPRVERPMEWSSHSSDDADWAAARGDDDDDRIDGPEGIVDGDEEESDGDAAAAAAAHAGAEAFPVLEAQIDAALEKLGGSAFVKMNWSAPRDASWILGGLECTSAGAVYLLLQSSDVLASDLTRALSQCADGGGGLVDRRPDPVVLVLRKWCKLLPSMVFRCFMRERRLVGVTQRVASNFYPFLPDRRDALRAEIGAFFEVSIVARFADPSVVFDVYVDRDSKVHLLDFNPWCASTDPVLFSWAELTLDDAGEAERESLDTFADFEIRVVTERVAVVPSDVCYYGVPSDLGQSNTASGATTTPVTTADVSTAAGIESFVAAARKEQADEERERKGGAQKRK